MATANNGAPLSALPDDVLQRILVGVPLDDHRVAAAACRAFHDVINGPRFPALRRKYGFAEYGVVVVDDTGDRVHKRVVSIRMAQQSGAVATISGPGVAHVIERASTTDGGTRLFASIWRRSAAPKILSVDASSRRWKHFATLPLNTYNHCIEWHDGRLYFTGGRMYRQFHWSNSLHAFNEVTGLWEELPPMPHACASAASGVIGNELCIAGGGDEHVASTQILQIYDITTRTWRLGAQLPFPCHDGQGVVVDGKLFVFGTPGSEVWPPPSRGMLVYDPKCNAWTEETVPFGSGARVAHACVHKGRIVVFLRNSYAYERAADGAWSPFSYGVSEEDSRTARSASGSVLLG